MRKLILAVAATGAAVALAAPAAAQYYPQSYGYGYGSPYGYNRWSGTQDLQRRLFNVQRSLGSVRPDQAYRLNAEANYLQRRLNVAARNGLDPYELRDIDAQVNRLERQLGRAVAYRGYGYNGYNGYYGDRDRDWRGGDRDRDEDDDRD